MIGAVIDRDPEVDHRIAGQESTGARVLNPFFDRRHELPWDRAAEDIVDEFEVAAARQWVQLDLAVAELAMTTSLLLVPAVRFRRRLDRLAIRNARRLQEHVN